MNCTHPSVVIRICRNIVFYFEWVTCSITEDNTKPPPNIHLYWCNELRAKKKEKISWLQKIRIKEISFYSKTLLRICFFLNRITHSRFFFGRIFTSFKIIRSSMYKIWYIKHPCYPSIMLLFINFCIISAVL